MRLCAGRIRDSERGKLMVDIVAISQPSLYLRRGTSTLTKCLLHMLIFSWSIPRGILLFIPTLKRPQHHVKATRLYHNQPPRSHGGLRSFAGGIPNNFLGRYWRQQDNEKKSTSSPRLSRLAYLLVSNMQKVVLAVAHIPSFLKVNHSHAFFLPFAFIFILQVC